MPGNRCDECGTKINRLKTPYKLVHVMNVHTLSEEDSRASE